MPALVNSILDDTKKLLGINADDPSFDTDVMTPGIQTVPLADCAFTNSKSFKEWTYDATVQYEPSPQVTTYASYRHGFRAGGFSPAHHSLCNSAGTRH